MREGLRTVVGRRRLDVIGAVGVGGAVGTVARYEIALVLPATGAAFPWAVFAVNVVGAFVLGVVMTFVLEHLPRTRYARPFAAVGFCGGLTTFSAWMLDSVLLADASHAGTAIVYIGASLLAGLASLFSGVVAVRASTRERA